MNLHCVMMNHMYDVRIVFTVDVHIRFQLLSETFFYKTQQKLKTSFFKSLSNAINQRVKTDDDRFINNESLHELIG